MAHAGKLSLKALPVALFRVQRAPLFTVFIEVRIKDAF